jgi:hypothetical protein
MPSRHRLLPMSFHSPLGPIENCSPKRCKGQMKESKVRLAIGYARLLEVVAASVHSIACGLLHTNRHQSYTRVRGGGPVSPRNTTTPLQQLQ